MTETVETVETDQSFHEDPIKWPKPMAAGLLVELNIGTRETSLHMPGGELFNLNSGTVRATSPELPDVVTDKFLPDGDGSFGARVIIPEPYVTYLDDHVYEALELTPPDADANDYGELVLVDQGNVTAIIPDELDDMNPPFTPLGKRVFIEYDYDDASVDVVGAESGETYGPEDDPNELVMPESSVAQQNNLATVTKTGPEVEHVDEGDRVIPPATTDSVHYKDEDYFYVKNESSLIAVV